MMAETRGRTGPAAPPLQGLASTRGPRPTHTVPAAVHTVHTSRVDAPWAAAPDVDEAPAAVHTGPSWPALVHTGSSLVHTSGTAAVHTGPTNPGAIHTGVHTPPARMWTVSVLVWAARWVAPAAGGVLLVGGAYAGPLSVVPAPVLLALAAVGWAVPTTGGDRR